MRPRSLHTGQRAAGRGGQSWKVGKWLRLHSCDWPEPGGGSASDDFTRPSGGCTALMATMKE